MTYKNLEMMQHFSEHLKTSRANTDIIQEIDAEIERMEDTGEYQTSKNQQRERVSPDVAKSIKFAADIVIFHSDNPNKITSVAIADMLGITSLWAIIKAHMTALRKAGILDSFDTSKANKNSKIGGYIYNPSNLPDVIYVSSLIDDETGEPTYYVLSSDSPLRKKGTTEDTRIKLTYYQLQDKGYIPVLSEATGKIVKYVHKRYVTPEGFSLA